jgi:hypothetical protein
MPGAILLLRHSSWWRNVFWFVVWRCLVRIPAGATVYLDMYFTQFIQSNTGIVPKIRPRPLPSTFLPVHYLLISYHLIVYCQSYSQRRETNRGCEAYLHYFRDAQREFTVEAFSACSPIILPPTLLAWVKARRTATWKLGVHYCWAPVTVAARSKAWILFARTDAGIVGSNPTQGMNVCVYAFILCLFCPLFR